MPVKECSRHYPASVAIRISGSILRWVRRLYRNGLVTFSDVKYAVRISERLRLSGLATDEMEAPRE